MKSRYIRLSLVILMLVLSLALLTFGVYSIVTNYSGVSNTVSFDNGDENVFVRINAKYEGPALAEGYNDEVNLELNRSHTGAYDDEELIDTEESGGDWRWALGETNFTSKQTVISFTFTITNLNGVNALGVEFKNIAYDIDQRFTTSYKQAQSSEELADAQLNLLSGSNQETVDLEQIVIPKDGTLCVSIVFQLEQFAQQFRLLNNIVIVFETIQ